MSIYAVTECLQDFILGLTWLFDHTPGLAGPPVQDEDRMEMGEIFEDVLGCPLDAMPLHA